MPAAEVRAAARLYAGCRNGAIYYGLGVTEHSQGSTMVMGIANLAMLTGNIGRPGATDIAREHRKVRNTHNHSGTLAVLSHTESVINCTVSTSCVEPSSRANFSRGHPSDLF